MDYIEVEEARNLPGLRLILTPRVPGPWGEAAKALLYVKKIPYTPVRQPPENEDRTALIDWTRQTSAPVAIYESERPRSGWAEILFLAERLAPQPSPLPADSFERTVALGLCHEICGEQGFGWSRRLQFLPTDKTDVPDTMPWKYGLDEAAVVARAPARMAEIQALLAGQLQRQREQGRRFFVGDSLSAVDVYWACFSNMLVPLSEQQSPMPSWIRKLYGDLRGCEPPAESLVAHRDFIFEEYLELPQRF